LHVTVELTSLTRRASSLRHPGESGLDEHELPAGIPHPRVNGGTAIAGQVTPLEERAPRRVLWREGLKRKLLGSADVLAVMLTLRVVEGDPGWHRTTLLFPAIFMLLLLFKIGGLYDRDDLRLVQSTLDEAPSLVQLTGLFTLGVTTLQWLFRGPLGTDDVPKLWLGAFVAVVCGRVIARAVAGRIAPPERCLVIGDAGRVQRIRERLASSRARARVIAAIEVTTQHL
jgi:hypothetical protein